MNRSQRGPSKQLKAKVRLWDSPPRLEDTKSDRRFRVCGVEVLTVDAGTKESPVVVADVSREQVAASSPVMGRVFRFEVYGLREVGDRFL